MANNLPQRISRQTTIIAASVIAIILIAVIAIYGIAYQQTKAFRDQAPRAYEALSQLGADSSHDDIHSALGSIPTVMQLPFVPLYDDYAVARTQSVVLNYYADMVRQAQQWSDSLEFTEQISQAHTSLLDEAIFPKRTEFLQASMDLELHQIGEYRQLNTTYADTLLNHNRQLRSAITDATPPDGAEATVKFALTYYDRAETAYQKYQSTYHDISDEPSLFLAESRELQEVLRLSLHTDAMSRFLSGMQGAEWMQIIPPYIKAATPLDISTKDTNRELAKRKLDYNLYMADALTPPIDHDSYLASWYMQQYYLSQFGQIIDEPTTPADLADAMRAHAEMLRQASSSLHLRRASDQINNLYQAPGYAFTNSYDIALRVYQGLNDDQAAKYRDDYTAFINSAIDSLPDKSPYYADNIARLAPAARDCAQTILAQRERDHQCRNDVADIEQAFRQLRLDVGAAHASLRESFVAARNDIE